MKRSRSKSDNEPPLLEGLALLLMAAVVAFGLWCVRLATDKRPGPERFSCGFSSEPLDKRSPRGILHTG